MSLKVYLELYPRFWNPSTLEDGNCPRGGPYKIDEYNNYRASRVV